VQRAWPWLAIAALCAVVLVPALDFQPLIAQGDHGRDLYAAAATLRGELPYRDYYWPYGPIMPLYYGLAFGLLGASAHSLLVAAAALEALTALLVYAMLARTQPRGLALLGAWWFLLFDRGFPHTWSHAGPRAAFVLLTLALLRYLDDASRRALWLACAATALLLLGKLNFGVVGWLGLSAAVVYGERHFDSARRSERLRAARRGLLAVAAVAVASYAWLLHGLPGYEVRQSLPFLPGDRLASEGVAAGLGQLIREGGQRIAGGGHALVAVVLTGAGLVLWVRELLRGAPPQARTRSAPSAARGEATARARRRRTRDIVVIAGFYLASLHELVLSGIDYRMA